MKLGISSYTYTWAVGLPGQRPSQPITALALLERTAELGARGLRDLPPYLALADRIRSRLVRMVVDAPQEHPNADEVVRAIAELLPTLERDGIALAIENHDRFAAEALAAIVVRIANARVGICLDTANSFGALQGPGEVWRTLAPYTLNVHVKDFTIRRANHNMGFVIEGCPAGQGRLDIAALLAELRQAGRDPNAILELWTPPESDLEATIAKEAAWARESVAFLRGVIVD